MVMESGHIIRYSPSSLKTASCLWLAPAGFRVVLSNQGSVSESAWTILSLRGLLFVLLAFPAYLPRSFAFIVVASSGFVCRSYLIRYPELNG
jgi:hypothetical protein